MNKQDMRKWNNGTETDRQTVMKIHKETERSNKKTFHHITSNSCYLALQVHQLNHDIKIINRGCCYRGVIVIAAKSALVSFRDMTPRLQHTLLIMLLTWLNWCTSNARQDESFLRCCCMKVFDCDEGVE